MTQKPKTIKKDQKAKCSPSAEEKDYTCYSHDALNKMKTLWNARHPDVKITATEPRDIWNTLRDNMSNVCNVETCWLRQNFMKDDTTKSLMAYTFAPESPTSWEKDPYEWLTSLDIERVMKQYEKKYKCFEFIGPSPIDFDTHRLYGECIWEELCKLNLKKLIKKGKNKIGIIFNLDPHYEEGSHWVSMFINIKEGYVFYFDSNGDPIPDEIMKLVDRVIKQAEEINISMNFYQNHPFEHQKSNTECGMFSLYLIITLLRDCKGFKEFMNKRVPDAKMKKLRNEYFNRSN